MIAEALEGKYEKSFFSIIFVSFKYFLKILDVELWGQTIMLLWAGSGEPKKVLGTDFQNKKGKFFCMHFFYILFLGGDAPVVGEHKYISLGTFFLL